MTARPRGWRVLSYLAVVVLTGCLAPTVSPAPPQPTPANPTQTASISPQPAPTPNGSAQLVVSASGTESCSQYNACDPVMLLARPPARSLFALDQNDARIHFPAQMMDTIQWELTGETAGAPSSIGVGSWAVGIGAIETSDAGSCNDPCTSPFFPSSLNLDCVKEFGVTPDVQAVNISATFGPACGIEVQVVPTPTPKGPPPTPVPAWTPPAGGILDDCTYRPSLLRIDKDGRPWYEEISNGHRIDTIEYEGWDVETGKDAQLDSPEGYQLLEWKIFGLSCVFGGDGIEWVGGEYDAWKPWNAVLGEQAGYVARQVFAVDRGNEGGPPPGAASLTSARYEQVDEDLLRALDAEIKQVGKDKLSSIYPDFFLGSRPATTNALGSVSSIGFPNANWSVFRDPQTKFRARLLHQYKTPAGNHVTALDQTLLAWDDCSALVIPDGAAGEPALDPRGKVASIMYGRSTSPDTLVVVEVADPTCQTHPVIGPLIAGLSK